MVKTLDSKYTQNLDSHRVKSLLPVKIMSCVHVKMRDRIGTGASGVQGIASRHTVKCSEGSNGQNGRGAVYKPSPPRKS